MKTESSTNTPTKLNIKASPGAAPAQETTNAQGLSPESVLFKKQLTLTPEEPPPLLEGSPAQGASLQPPT